MRRDIKVMRLNLSEDDKQAAADKVFDRLEQTQSFKLANHILMYYSLPDELPTHEFIIKWCSEKNLYLPRVNGVNLDILPYDATRLKHGSFDIEEPCGDDTVNPSILDLIIVPAVAFDKDGNRLGRGKGFYDRLLNHTKAVKIGVAYDFQLVDEIPVEPHDIPVDRVITPMTEIIISEK